MTEKGDLLDFDIDDSAESTLTEKIKDDRNAFERLLAKIPGIGSYMDNNDRREADQLLRNTLADRLEQSRLTLGSIHQTLSADIVKAIDYAEPLGRANTQLTGLIGKIRAAPTGYSGWLDAVKIGEEELEKIYEFDNSFFDHADLIDATVNTLNKAVNHNGDISAGIIDLSAAVTNASRAFDERNELLSGFGSD